MRQKCHINDPDSPWGDRGSRSRVQRSVSHFSGGSVRPDSTLQFGAFRGMGAVHSPPLPSHDAATCGAGGRSPTCCWEVLVWEPAGTHRPPPCVQRETLSPKCTRASQEGSFWSMEVCSSHLFTTRSRAVSLVNSGVFGKNSLRFFTISDNDEKTESLSFSNGA